MIARRVSGPAAAVAVAIGLAAPGCSSQTGIVVNVTQVDSFTTQIPKIRVFVGVPGTAVPGSSLARFVDDADPGDEVATLGRDLATDPYRLLLTPTAALPADAALKVVVVGFEDPGTPAQRRVIAYGELDPPVHFATGQVLSWDLALGPLDGRTVVMNPLGCLRIKTATGDVWIGAHDDWDCDRDPNATDCAPADPKVNHGATEVCGNNVDDDCNGKIDDDKDQDGDGVFACQGDCVDNPSDVGADYARSIHRGAFDTLGDGIDQDCSGACNEIDLDQDHYAPRGVATEEFEEAMPGTCKQGDAYRDCNDADPAIHPEATDAPTDGVDNDCSGRCDDTDDVDGDGYTRTGFQTTPVGPTGRCPAAIADCDDDPTDDPPAGPTAAEVHPGAAERCDGVDENCDGVCDDDSDGDGYSACGLVDTGAQACLFVTDSCGPNQQCDCEPGSAAAHPPGPMPTPELCDGHDQNCDGVRFTSNHLDCVGRVGTTECSLGLHTCDDTATSNPWGVCAIDPQMPNPVPLELCGAYDQCLANPATVDPYLCALARMPGLACAETTSSLTACTPAEVPIVDPSPATCATATWSLPLGTQQGAWTVGLRQGLGPVAAQQVGCAPTFVVQAFNGAGTGNVNGPRGVLLLERNGLGQLKALVVTLQASAGACSAANNLSCGPVATTP